MTDKKATLEIDGIDDAIELPIYAGTLGPDVVDVGGLTAKGLFTYDPGFVSTASCESKITFIDGSKGILSPSISRHATYYCTVNFLLRIRKPTLYAPWACILWSTSRSALSSMVFAAMPIRWPLCAVW